MQLKPAKTRFFQNEHVPINTSLCGLSALANLFKVQAPVRQPACVSAGHIKGGSRADGAWLIYDKRYAPENTVEGHLIFAVKHENIDLLLLKRIFQHLSDSMMIDFVASAPTGLFTRQIWFLYEFLKDKTLPIPDAPSVTTVDLLDTNKYFANAGTISKRHKVRNNLLGNNLFCPIIRKTDTLQALINSNLSAKAMTLIGRTSKQLVSRAASFLLLADSKASFQIEGENPPRNRLERWGKAVLQTGRHELSVDEILRLHGILIEDNRFIHAGLRSEGVFLGERDNDRQPIPEFIGAKPKDLPDLVHALVSANTFMSESTLDPVLQAAATAFGFVYIHPFEDGNGRLHRCLIHHVLSQRQFTPPGLIFPVSSVMLTWIEQYRSVLQSHSAPLMEYIEWRPTASGNVEVVNDTADLYRFFDCTQAAEFLYHCVERTVKEDLPRELDYLLRHDEASRQIMDTVEMSDRLADDFIMFMRQNAWALPQKRRHKEFAKLNDNEAEQLEKIVRVTFKGFDA